MITLNRTVEIVRRTLALSAVLGMGVAVAQAQDQDAGTPAATSQPTLNFHLPVIAATPNFSSSAADNDAAGVSVADSKDPFDFLAIAGTQPPPQHHTYNRPRYRGSNTNADGSAKYGFMVGGGFTSPVGDESNFLTTSWAVGLGASRNWSKNFGVSFDFNWDNFGLTGQTLNNYSTVYAGSPTNAYGIDGSTHIWSFALNPTYSFGGEEGFGAYVVGGGGFYHKATNFFIVVPQTFCDYYYGCYQYAANATVQNYTSNSPGIDGGFGITYKTSKFSNSKLFAEVRYVHTFNTYKPGITVDTPPPVQAAYTGWNYFPQNSQTTSYFPVKFGLRF